MDGPEDIPIAQTTEDIYEYIGRRIRVRRKHLRMTHRAVAQAIGVSVQMIAKYETARYAVSIAGLWKISQALNIQMSWFFDGFGGEAVPGPDFAKYLTIPGAADLLETYAAASYSNRLVIRSVVKGFKASKEEHNATTEGQDDPG